MNLMSMCENCTFANGTTMNVKYLLKRIWVNSFLSFYLSFYFSDESPLKQTLKISWIMSILAGLIVGLAAGILSGSIILWSAASFLSYCVSMHLLVAFGSNEVNKLIVSEEHPLDFEKYTHMTKYKQSGDDELDKYLARYFFARQYSIYTIMSGALCVALAFIMLSVLALSM